MRGIDRLTAITVVALMVVGACQAAAPTAPPTAPAGTQWQQVLAGIGPKGEVEPAMALAAFSLAVAPLPGVDLPAGPSPTSAEIIDGAAPVRWLLRVWDRLTPEQQAAATVALSALGRPDFTALEPPKMALAQHIDLAAPASGANEKGSCGIWLYDVTPVALPAEVQPYAEDLQLAAAAFAGHLHRDPVSKWGVCLYPGTGTTAATVTRILDSAGADFGTPDHCTIYLNSSYFEGLKASDPGRYGYAISVAAFRCFLQTAAYYGKPAVRAPYVEEGLTAWAAGRVSEEVFGGPGNALENVWPGYLLEPGESLFTRSWDAIGFYSQLEEIRPGQLTWDVVDPMLGAPDAESAFYRSGARAVEFWAVWAAGFFRDPDRGSAWDIAGPGVTGDASPRIVLSVANGTSKDVQTAPLTAAIFEVTSTADVTYVGGTDVRFSDGAIDQQIHDNSFPFCTKEGGRGDCTCPPETLRGRAGLPTPPPLASPFHFALTGRYDPVWELGGGTGSLVGWSLDDFCVKESSPKPQPTARPTAKPRGGPNPCAKGCAKTIGEPHLHTINDVAYNFQAAGEYEMLSSADGLVEMQARQAPYPNASGVAYNIGLAWEVNGHRVTMYSHELVYELRLDGQPLEGQTTTDLGGGTQVTLLTNGVEVAYADGTLSWGLGRAGVADIGLDLTVAPSDALRATATGLLGPVPAGAEVPALRDGTVLSAPVDAAARYDQLYQQLAPAWHVSDATSLFDYEPGQSTASFDVPDFPSRDAPTSVEGLQLKLGLDQFQAAAEACAALRSDQQEFLNCVFDVMATQNPAWADFYKLVAQFLVDGPVVDPGATPIVGPIATPTTTLPAGFFQVATGANLIRGATLGPDGELYLSLANSDGTYTVSAVNTATGEVRATITTTGAGDLFVVEGSVWAATDDPTGYGLCTIARLDPSTLAAQASIPVGCDAFGVSAAAVEDGLWWVDRSTADADGRGGQLRHIDPATNVVDRSVELPFLNGRLVASRTTVFYGDTAANKGFYRLLPGAVAFARMGALTVSFFPAEEGVWGQPAENAIMLPEAAYYTTSSTPDRTINIDTGALVGADESAVYVSRIDELWRYPIDGSPPALIAKSTTLQTADQERPLFYGADRLLFGAGKMVQLWFVAHFPTQDASAVIIQAAPLP